MKSFILLLASFLTFFTGYAQSRVELFATGQMQTDDITPSADGKVGLGQSENNIYRGYFGNVQGAAFTQQLHLFSDRSSTGLAFEGAETMDRASQLRKAMEIFYDHNRGAMRFTTVVTDNNGNTNTDYMLYLRPGQVSIPDELHVGGQIRLVGPAGINLHEKYFTNVGPNGGFIGLNIDPSNLLPTYTQQPGSILFQNNDGSWAFESKNQNGVTGQQLVLGADNRSRFGSQGYTQDLSIYGSLFLNKADGSNYLTASENGLGIYQLAPQGHLHIRSKLILSDGGWSGSSTLQDNLKWNGNGWDKLGQDPSQGGSVIAMATDGSIHLSNVGATASTTGLQTKDGLVVENDGTVVIPGPDVQFTPRAVRTATSSSSNPALQIGNNQPNSSHAKIYLTQAQDNGALVIEAVRKQGVAYGNIFLNPKNKQDEFTGAVLIGTDVPQNDLANTGNPLPDQGFLRNGGNQGIVTKLVVNGNIRTKGLVADVDQSWSSYPDYVFEPTYKLMMLDSLDKFVTTRCHLPEIPTQLQVKEQGVDIVNQNLLLLKKIEELTLYIIELNKRISKLEK